MTCQNLWDITTAVLRGKFMVLNVNIWKEERFQINDLSIHLKKLKKKPKNKKLQTEPKESRRKEIEIREKKVN